ncbi:MAG: NAD-dependent epimerase/dehydratase family protein, partial [bacterium]|nr:NAD-dependent epimerase/dehydratase family protein [bacterium]
MSSKKPRRKEKKVSVKVDIPLSGQKENPKAILLTGATGFLGAHILYDLLDRTEAQIYCLIRGESQGYMTQRLQSVVDFYFDDKGIDLSRIIAVQGDIAVDGLGLDNDMMKKFRSEIDTVIHTAADVRHFGEYSHFENINVMGTRRILDIVSERKCRFHHISTLSVSGSHVPDMSKIIFKETDFDRGQIMDSVYGRSKYEAEELVRNAMTDELSTTIYRVGNLVGDYRTGKFQRSIETNAF